MQRSSFPIWRTLYIFAASSLVGCGAPKPSNNIVNSAPSTGGKPAVRAALALDIGGVDDKSFNASAWEGLQMAEKQLQAEGKFVSAQNASDYKNNLTLFASQNYDIVFAVGYLMEDAVKDVSAQFPNVKFAIVDGNAPDRPNCASIQFREEQATFLAGYLAASMSKTKCIGFVGGQQISLIKKFEAGYRAGARTAKSDIRILSSYTGDWDDVSKGKSQAEQQFSNGADIIFQAAGKAGLGVIKAAEEKGVGFYAVGVDQDQDGIAPGRVLTSVMKRLDNAVLDTVKHVKEGKFVAGRQLYDLKSGGVGLSEMKYTRKDIPTEVLANVDKLTKMVEDGTVVPPTTLEDEAKFSPPKL